MAKTISSKSSVKASAAKPVVKPQSWDKNPNIETAIGLYKLEDGDKTEEE